jgi:hypothetical protein
MSRLVALDPVMRQVLAQSQEPRRRQLDWLTALEERAHDVRSQKGQSNERSEVALAHSETFGHCLERFAVFLKSLKYMMLEKRPRNQPVVLAFRSRLVRRHIWRDLGPLLIVEQKQMR